MKTFAQSRVVAAPRVPQHSYSMSSLKRFNIITIITFIIAIILINIILIRYPGLAGQAPGHPIIITIITFIATVLIIIPITNIMDILIRYPGLAGQAPGPPPASSQFYLARSESR